MKYRSHYSKTAAQEDAIHNAHLMVIADGISNASPQEAANAPTPSEAASATQMANIIGYIHGHRNTQLATLSTSEAGIGALKNIQQKLYLAGEELLRMEDESGAPLNATQMAKVDAYFKESQNIDNVLQTAKNKPLASIHMKNQPDV